MELNYKDFINPNDEYLIVKDGEIIEHSKKVSSFLLNQDLTLKVFYYFKRDVNINYQITSNVNIKITEIFIEMADNCHSNINFEIAAHSQVKILSVKNNQLNGKVRINTNISLAEAAYIKLNELASLPGDCELKTNLHLNKPYAKAEVNTVNVNSSNKEQVFSINVFHNSKRTISDLISYGIASHGSNLIINTDGIIKKGAGKVELRQKTKGMILDEKSHVSATPVLEIDDYDVIASHGASIGAIDEELLYYLMSRGISREDSEKLVISGFINPFLASIKEEILLDWIKSLIRLNF
ncbi:MAG: SufD family Fe-S cluster assembly protein [Bacilli bacterium]|nr:SufD family Fe-S cluster assembly protein [Bacilli bacterium]